MWGLYFRVASWLGPGMVVGVVVAIVWVVVRRRAGTPIDRIVSEVLLTLWLAFFLSVTLSPAGSVIEFGARRTICFATTYASPPPLGLIPETRTLNAMALVPVGVMAAVSAGRRIPWLVAGLATPALVEFVQWLVPGLGRSCDVLDFADNYYGFLVGASAGVVGWLAYRLVRRATPWAVRT